MKLIFIENFVDFFPQSFVGFPLDFLLVLSLGEHCLSQPLSQLHDTQNVAGEAT